MGNPEPAHRDPQPRRSPKPASDLLGYSPPPGGNVIYSMTFPPGGGDGVQDGISGREIGKGEGNHSVCSLQRRCSCGRPDSTTKVARVLIGAPGRETKGTVR